MTKEFLLAALLGLFPYSLAADPGDCLPRGCRAEFRLSSTSDLRRYGVLIAAPDSGCGRVRFRIEMEGTGLLGQTPPLRPGELAVVKMGRAFPEGDHILTIAAEGCNTLPAETRRVTLAKVAPDHAWRSSVQ